jgi:hypothetical protein
MVEVFNKMSSSRQNLPSVWKWFKNIPPSRIQIGKIIQWKTYPALGNKGVGEFSKTTIQEC